MLQHISLTFNKSQQRNFIKNATENRNYNDYRATEKHLYIRMKWRMEDKSARFQQQFVMTHKYDQNDLFTEHINNTFVHWKVRTK